VVCAQCALFLGGTLIELPANALPQSRPAGSLALDSLTLALVRGFASPWMAATAVLALACQLPARRLCALDVMDLGYDGAYADVNRQRFPIPAPARGPELAQRLARQRSRAALVDPLFCHPRDHTTRISHERMHGALRRISGATGLALLPDRRFADDEGGPRPWLAADSYTVTRLESLGDRELLR